MVHQPLQSAYVCFLHTALRSTEWWWTNTSGCSAERYRKQLQQIGVANACRRLKGAGDELVKGLVFQLERNLSLVGSKGSGTMFWFL